MRFSQGKPLVSIFSIKMMDSPFMKLKYYLHAYWMGWKTRKLASLIKFQNLKSQVKEIEEFNKSSDPKARPNNFVLKARENYANSLQNAINR